jgi:hypothetical protein
MSRFAYAPQDVILPNRRISDALRYGGVLTVWLGLTLVKPSLGLKILRERRPDSPLGRPGGQRIPSENRKTPDFRAFHA